MPGWARRRIRGVAVDGGAVGLLDGAQPGGDPGLAGGDGLAVAPAVGAFGQVLAGPLDLAEVGLSLVGMSGDGEQGDVGGGGVQDEADRLGLGVAAGQGEDPGAVGLGPGLLRVDAAVPDPVVELGEDHVGAVDLVAGGGEVLPIGPSSAPRLVQYFSSLVACGWSGKVPERACLRSSVFRCGWIAPVSTKRTRPWAKSGAWGRAASQMASRRAVTWSTMVPRLSASVMPSAMSRSYRGRSGERAVYGQPVGGSCRGPGRYRSHTSVMRCFSVGLGTLPLW